MIVHVWSAHKGYINDELYEDGDPELEFAPFGNEDDDEEDPFGNIDESFEKEVTIDYDGQLPNGDRLTLPNDGVVNLKKGLARVRIGRGKQ